MKRKMFTALLFILVCSLSEAFAYDVQKPIPFDRVRYFIVVKAKINNSEKDYNFIIDTGALTFIDKSVANELGLKQRGMMAKIDTLNLSGQKIERVFCFTTFNVKLFKKFGVPIHGIIGSNLLDRYKVIFDFKSLTVTLSEDTTLLGHPADGIFMNFQNHPINNAPLVKFKAGSKIIEGMIDTGQPFPLVFPFADFEEYNNSCISEFIKSKGVMVKWPMTKPKFNYLARLDSISFENTKVADVICVFGELPPMLSMPLICTDFLSKFTMILNYPKHEMVLLPYKESHFENNKFSTGLNLNVSETNQIYVEGVWENSPADKAGIKTGDIILGFNSKKVTPKNLIELQDGMSDDKVESIDLEVQTDTGVKSVKLTKEMLFRDL